MNRSRAARARDAAMRALAYRAWYLNPSHAVIPSIAIISDRSLQRREEERQLRRAQFGAFDTVAAVATSRIAPAF